jgi:hypothetical protein
MLESEHGLHGRQVGSLKLAAVDNYSCSLHVTESAQCGSVNISGLKDIGDST